MGVIIFIAFCGLVFFAFTGMAIFAGDGDVRAVSVAGSVVSLFVIFLTFAIGGEVSVPVNTTAVPQAFGAVSGSELGPGVHWTFQPWLSVTDIDETVQTTPFTGTIRIGGQQTATANIKVKWQIRPSAADSLFRQYANQGPSLMATITSNVVLLDLENVVNNVMGDYDPITDVSSVANANGTHSLFTTFGPVILADMRADIGSQVNIIQLTMPNVGYTPAVEAKLQAIQQAYADYAIATENVAVAHEQSLAFVNLGQPTLSQLIAQCLAEAKDNQNLQCIPGATSNLSIAGKP